MRVRPTRSSRSKFDQRVVMPPVRPAYELKTRRCTIHVGRFRWDLLENGKRIESSAESFPTRTTARQDGLSVMEKLLRELGGMTDKLRDSSIT